MKPSLALASALALLGTGCRNECTLEGCLPNLTVTLPADATPVSIVQGGQTRECTDPRVDCSPGRLHIQGGSGRAGETVTINLAGGGTATAKLGRKVREVYECLDCEEWTGTAK